MASKPSSKHVAELCDRIAATIVAHHPDFDGGATSVPRLLAGHLVRPMPLRAYVYEPSLCIVAKGSKNVLLGERRFSYDARNFLLTTIGLPALIEVPGASAARPHVALQVPLDLEAARELITQMDVDGVPPEPPCCGYGVAPLSADLLDAVARLVALLDSPRDVPYLAPMLHREILYRLLAGPVGALLRQTVRVGASSRRVADAVAWVRTHFAQDWRIEDLAARFAMGTSTFHRQFQALTTMSPLQYRKHLRLHEARRLMLSEELDAASAAFRVGYESATQFTREYGRLFGAPPRRDVTALRERAAVRPAEAWA